jgi:TPR repeat protein
MEAAAVVQDKVQAEGDLSRLDSNHMPQGNLKAWGLRARQAHGDVQASLALAALELCDPVGDWDGAIACLEHIVDGQHDKALVAQAKCLLADAWVKGLGGLSDCEQARGYYIDAAQDGVSGAAYALGCWYLGTNPRFASSWPDRELAAYFFETGAQAGSNACAKALANLHLTRELRFNNHSMAIELLTQAAAEGDAEAGAMLAAALESCRAPKPREVRWSIESAAEPGADAREALPAWKSSTLIWQTRI